MKYSSFHNLMMCVSWEFSNSLNISSYNEIHTPLESSVHALSKEYIIVLLKPSVLAVI